MSRRGFLGGVGGLIVLAACAGKDKGSAVSSTSTSTRPAGHLARAGAPVDARRERPAAPPRVHEPRGRDERAAGRRHRVRLAAEPGRRGDVRRPQRPRRLVLRRELARRSRSWAPACPRSASLPTARSSTRTGSSATPTSTARAARRRGARGSPARRSRVGACSSATPPSPTAATRCWRSGASTTRPSRSIRAARRST